MDTRPETRVLSRNGDIVLGVERFSWQHDYDDDYHHHHHHHEGDK